MENLIVIEGREKYQYKDIKGLIENFICKDYFNMSKEEKMNQLEKKTIANTIQSNIKVVKLQKEKKDFDENSFVIYDEISYILSMIKFNKIILLERIDANIFGRYINKQNMKDNYIIINKFAKEIMEKYLENN